MGHTYYTGYDDQLMSKDNKGIIVQDQSGTPIDKILDRLDWEPTGDTEDGDGIPIVTHKGVLNLGGLSLQVFQLSNGLRVIPEEDMEQFFKLLQ
jgi:hypothetical protein